jgi:7,8-dihydro-6-hydroxymethylpterin-pyrophosphokinase
MIGYLGLGSNVGDRRANLQAAVDALGAHGVSVLASSSTYDTDPVGEVLDQPDFLNACVRIETALEPEDLLAACKAVEREHRSERLTLPHEQATSRRFVLVPLLELDFELATPGGRRLADALAALPVDEDVRRAGAPLRVPAR